MDQRYGHRALAGNAGLERERRSLEKPAAGYAAVLKEVVTGDEVADAVREQMLPGGPLRPRCPADREEHRVGWQNLVVVETDAGIASAINNAIARVAGLIGSSAIGAFVASRLAEGTFAPNPTSVDAFREAIVLCAALVGSGGVAALGIENPRRHVKAEECPGGQLVGIPRPGRSHAETAVGALSVAAPTWDRSAVV